MTQDIEPWREYDMRNQRRACDPLPRISLIASAVVVTRKGSIIPDFFHTNFFFNTRRMLCAGAIGMATLKAKVIDNFHLELERGISINTGEVFVKIIDKKPIESLRGAWGYDIDSADFVENLRKSKKIEPV